jgi:hypothetical protein
MDHAPACVLLLAACATTPAPAAKGGPRGLRADEHLDVASQHEELARRSARWPDTRSAPPGSIVAPWSRSWHPDADHARLAAIHRGRAAQLEAAFDEACGARPLAEIAVSPLRHGISGWNTRTGVIVSLSAAAGSADQLMSDLRCHRAWMMLSSRSGMDDGPLDLPGIEVDAHGDASGITLAIVVDDKLVVELQRRMTQELARKEQE